LKIRPACLAPWIVLALQTVVSRENNPTDPVVLTIGSIHGGTAGNIIPDDVPAPHSPEWAPDLKPTLTAAIRAESDPPSDPRLAFDRSPRVARAEEI